MTFQEQYEYWLNMHLMERKGENKRRQENGLGHVEKLILEAGFLEL